ncbi:unnamed protein product [Gadus morhua 'NCC']
MEGMGQEEGLAPRHHISPLLSMAELEHNPPASSVSPACISVCLSIWSPCSERWLESPPPPSSSCVRLYYLKIYTHGYLS